LEHFKIQLFSTSQLGGILDIGYESNQSEIIFDLLYVFNGDFDTTKQQINVDYKHKNTEDIQSRLESFILKYKNILPQIQQLGSKFKKLEKNEWFFVLPAIEFTTQQKYELEKELNILNSYNSNISEEKVLEIFGCIMDNYEVITFDLDKDRKIKIGEDNRDKRICRFCNKKKPDVKFKKEAHAISEALGNKKLILNEECDSCNEFFDENIERDFIFYHDLARTMFGIKNKDNNFPKMKGNNFEFFKDRNSNNLSIAILQDAEKHTKGEPPKNVVFKTGNKIKIQNIYKALCKFALSVIDSNYIKNFEDTIKWLKNEKEVKVLPKIAVWHSYKFFTNTPEVTLYLRNNDNFDLPYLVGEFRFTYYMYVFIVPLSNQDKKDFLIDKDYKNYLKCFKQVTSIGEFNYVDFSENVEKDLNFNINFEQRKD
jgi:hypothetical protein